VELFGGKGNDRLLGSRFNDVLSGCDGDDDLFGGKGNDMIIGGMGKDELHSRFGDDMLIGGALTVEQDVAKLQSMLSAFNVSPSCVIDDHAKDQLFGTPGADKLFCGPEDKIVKLRR
jgi:Ca2+-binding RTX toxin-like protein